MKVVLFGGTGMVGGGVLRECLLAPDVTAVLSVVRKPSGSQSVDINGLASMSTTYDASRGG